MKETSDLLSRLNNVSNESELEKHLENIEGMETPLKRYLDGFLISRNMSQADVVRKACLTDYGNQILNGYKKNPSFDKVIAIAIALDMNLEETNKLLQLSGNKTLYAKSRRDSIIIYAINKKMNIMSLNYELQKHGEAELQ